MRPAWLHSVSYTTPAYHNTLNSQVTLALHNKWTRIFVTERYSAEWVLSTFSGVRHFKDSLNLFDRIFHVKNK